MRNDRCVLRFVSLLVLAAIACVASCGGSTPASQPPSTPAPKQPADQNALAARHDSYILLIGGQQRGSQTTSLELTAEGWRYTDDVRLGERMEQHTELTMTASLEMRSVTQRGKIGGVPTAIDVQYSGGRATGTATTLGPDGKPSAISIDTGVPPKVIDDNALQVIISTLAMKEGATHELDVLSSGTGELHRVRATVSGKEQVAVVAGTFEAWRVDVAGGELEVSMFVSVVAPQRVIKVSSARAPMEAQLSSE